MNLDLVLMELSQYMREEKYKRKNKEGKYKEEKIPVLDTKNMSNVDTVYKKFRRIENDNYYRTEQEIFYKQAKFLENFEDNYKIKQDIYSSYIMKTPCTNDGTGSSACRKSPAKAGLFRMYKI